MFSIFRRLASLQAVATNVIAFVFDCARLGNLERCMNNWPHTIPVDLAKALADLDEMRFQASDADRWGVIRDWLVKHDVKAPEHSFPSAPELGFEK